MKDVCPICGKELSTVEFIYAAEGFLYCSHDCTIKGIKRIHPDARMLDDSEECITELYNALVELVTPQDIGIVRKETK